MIKSKLVALTFIRKQIGIIRMRAFLYALFKLYNPFYEITIMIIIYLDVRINVLNSSEKAQKNVYFTLQYYIDIGFKTFTEPSEVT